MTTQGVVLLARLESMLGLARLALDSDQPEAARGYIDRAEKLAEQIMEGGML